MIIAKATLFFTALAVSTFSAISAQNDDAVEIDTAVPKTTKMPKNKKGKKGGKAVHTKSGKKGKKFTSPNSSSTTISPSSSPTGVCETRFISRQAWEIEESKKTLAYYIEQISEDPVLSQVPEVGALLNQAASVDAALASTLYGEATGCDFEASLANSLLDDILSTRRHLEEEYVCQESPGPDISRKLQGDLLAPIIDLAETIIRLFLTSVIQFDKLNKVYPLFMGLLGEITCSYYALSLAVVDIVKALSLKFAGFAYDLSSPFHEGVFGCLLIAFEEGNYFPDIFSIPTVFDAAACGL